MTHSELLRELGALTERQREGCHLDGIATLHEASLSFIESSAASAPSTSVERALWLFSYAEEIRKIADIPAVMSDFRAYSKWEKQRRRWFGARRVDRIDRATRADTERINEWVLDAFRHTLAVSQAVHIVEEVSSTRRPDRWMFDLPELTEGNRPDLRRCGVSPLHEVMADPPFTDDIVWHPMWAMGPASRQLTVFMENAGWNRKRRGAFRAVFDDNPDFISQAANSAVEALTRTATGLIKRHPDGPKWLRSFTRDDGSPRRPNAGELPRGSATVQRNFGVDDFDAATQADAVLGECVSAATRVRDALEDLKHRDGHHPDEYLRLCRCLVATEAVLIVLSGIVQLRVDEPRTRDAWRRFDLDELELFAANASQVVSTKSVVSHVAFLGAAETRRSVVAEANRRPMHRADLGPGLS